MSTPKPVQHRCTVRGRSLHFVSYEGRAANPRRGEAGQPAMWYLMVEGHRCPVMPHLPDQPMAEVARALEQWAEANLFGAAAEPARRVRPRGSSTQPQREDWWSPN